MNATHDSIPPGASRLASSDPRSIKDRRASWQSRYDQTRAEWAREHLKSNPQIIEEYRNNPLSKDAPHSADLELLLNYFRTHPVLGRYFIYTSIPWNEYRISILRKRGEEPDVFPSPVFSSESDAGHGVFLERIRVLTEESK